MLNENIRNLNDDVDLRALFAMNLYDYMYAADLNARELAAKVGLSEGSISYYLSGKKYPKPATIRKLADALGVRPTDLTELNYKDTAALQGDRPTCPEEYARLRPDYRELVDSIILGLWSIQREERQPREKEVSSSI